MTTKTKSYYQSIYIWVCLGIWFSETYHFQRITFKYLADLIPFQTYNSQFLFKIKAGRMSNKIKWPPLGLYQFVMRHLQLQVHKVLLTPVSAQRGPAQKLLSQRNFGTKLAPYLYTSKTTINQRNNLQKMFTVSKWRPIYWFSFCENGHVT